MPKDELNEKLIGYFYSRGHKGREVVDEVKDILSLLAPELEKAKKYDAHLLDLEQSKAHADRLIEMADAEDREMREKARKWDRIVEAYISDEEIGCSYSETIKEIHRIITVDALAGKEAENV